MKKTANMASLQIHKLLQQQLNSVGASPLAAKKLQENMNFLAQHPNTGVYEVASDAPSTAPVAPNKPE